MSTDWSEIITMFVIWIAAQGGLGYLASIASEIFNGILFPKLARGMKIFIVVLMCLLLSFMEAIQAKLIVLPINFKDAVVVVGVGMIIFAGSQVWWKQIINPKPNQEENMKPYSDGPPEIKECKAETRSYK